MSQATTPGDQPADDALRPVEPRLTSKGRSVISLLLLIHALCIATLLSSSYAPSVLQMRLTQLFAPYVNAFGLDPMGKELFLTHGELDDVDWRLEWLERGVAEDSIWNLALPRSGSRIGFARRREQRLVWEIASRLLEEENGEAAAEAGRLIAAMGRWLVFDQGARPAEVRVRRHTLQAPDAVGSTDLLDRDSASSAYFDTLYRASIVVEGENVRIVRRTVAAEEAPSRRRISPGVGSTP